MSSVTLPQARPDREPQAARRPGSWQHRELGRVLGTFRREFFWVGVFSLVSNLLILTPTLYMLQVFDRVLVSNNTLTLIALSGLALLLFAVMGFAEWVRLRLLVRASAKFDAALSSRVFGASFEARLGNTAPGGGVPQQPLADLTQLRQFMTGPGVYAIFDLPWSLIFIAVLFLMHPWLGWTAVAFGIVQALAAVVGSRIIRPLHATAMAGSTDAQSFLHARLRNAEVVEAMGMRRNLRQQWLQVHQRQLEGEGTAFECSQRQQAFMKFLQYAQQAMTLAVGALLVVQGEIGAGAMIASNALIGNALRPFGALVGTWRQLLDARESYGRLDTVLAGHPERSGARLPDHLQGQVTLQGLSASAPGRDSPILNGLDATFQPGEVIGIVGPSGAGKSTLARCLVGTWPDTQGQVLLDGHPLHAWQREALGAHLGYLPQDADLLDGTIAENIARFGALDSEQVIEASRRAGLHELILRLPKGYDTRIGEAGSLLSGGQRQRVGLARALYGDPCLVVLDEPNAHLDDQGELDLVHAVRDLKARGKTVFMIVHQPHLLAVADRILLLEKGCIARIVPSVAKPAVAPALDSPT